MALHGDYKLSPHRCFLMRNSTITVRKEGDLIFYDFLDNKGTGAALQRIPETTKFHWSTTCHSWGWMWKQL